MESIKIESPSMNEETDLTAEQQAEWDWIKELLVSDVPKAVDSLWRLVNTTHKQLRIIEKKNESLQD